MNPERWGKIKKVFEVAADLTVREQVAFVRKVALEDAELEAEVLRLLRAHASNDDFLEEPAADLHTYISAKNDQPFLAMETIIAKRFEILRFLNRGGMGEVYEAWDAELKEAVALKTIRPEIASHADVIERFKIEVKQAREVSHPNICRVHELFSHDVEPGNRVWFLSMELLRGDTLLERIRTGGPLDSSLAFSIVEQVVSGLDAAHARGLVHRDFKSSNVILIPDVVGTMRAVITDFGLSLKMQRPTGRLAEPGGMGTPGYMAPEQEQDGEVGPLADQYALGAVMCEMLSGTLPHRLESNRGTVKSILALPKHRFAPRWESVIRKCLEQDPHRRFSTIGEVSAALLPPGMLGTPFRIATALLLIALLASSSLLWLRDRGKCRICNIVQLTPETDESDTPSLSRDGNAVAYSSDREATGNLDIFFRALPEGRTLRITSDPARDRDPSMFPDGTAVAFRSERNGGGIYLADVRGGAERLLVPRGRNPQISPDGRTLAYWTGDPDPGVAIGKVFLLSLRGGEPVQIAESFLDARFPAWSNDGHAVIFSGCETSEKTTPGCLEWWIASIDGSRIVNTHALERLQAEGITLSRPGTGSWHEGGIVFSGGVKGLKSNLWKISLNPQTWKVEGRPRLLLQEDAPDLYPALAANGSVAFTRLSGALHIWRIEHASHPHPAKPSKVTSDAQIDVSPFVAAGGRWLVFGRGLGDKRSVWRRDNFAASEELLLSSGQPMRSPIVDRTGELLVYEQLENEGSSIYSKSKGRAATRLCRGCAMPTGWFDTDRLFLYRDGLPSVIKMADPRTGMGAVVLREDSASLGDADWSETNELMLFTESKADRKSLFAVHLPRLSGKVQGEWIRIPDKGLSPMRPRWSGDGRTIFYISNSDGFFCVYGQSFSPEKGKVIGAPFAIAHFHKRPSIDDVLAQSLNLSASGDSLYLNLGEQSSTIWIGSLRQH